MYVLISTIIISFSDLAAPQRAGEAETSLELGPRALATRPPAHVPLKALCDHLDLSEHLSTVSVCYCLIDFESQSVLCSQEPQVTSASPKNKTTSTQQAYNKQQGTCPLDKGVSTVHTAHPDSHDRGPDRTPRTSKRAATERIPTWDDCSAPHRPQCTEIIGMRDKNRI